jgi:hypothetical protein
MDDNSNWAEEQAKNVKERRERERTECESRVIDGKLIAAHLPELWSELKDELGAQFRALVQAVGDPTDKPSLVVECPDLNTIAIKETRGFDSVSVCYKSDLQRISCGALGWSATFYPKVINGKVVLVGENRGAAIDQGMRTPKEIARALLDSISSRM